MKSQHNVSIFVSVLSFILILWFGATPAYALFDDVVIFGLGDNVCPRPGEVDSVISDQFGLSANDKDLAYKQFYEYENSDGNKHRIKLIKHSNDSLGTFCIEDKENAQNGRTPETSIIKVCVVDFASIGSCVTLHSNETGFAGITRFDAFLNGADQLCVQANVLITSINWGNEGCVEVGQTVWPGAMCLAAVRHLEEAGKLENCLCFPSWIPAACYNWWTDGIPGLDAEMKDQLDDGTALGKFVRHSFQFTAPVVNCVEETVATLFQNQKTNCLGEEQNIATPYALMRAAMKNAVVAAMVLYVILFSYRVILGQVGSFDRGKGEILWLVIKLSLVAYFAISDGIEQWYSKIVGTMRDLTGVMISAAGGTEIPVCNLIESVADGGRYHFLASLPSINKYSLWIELDCKVLSYLGFGTFTGEYHDFFTLILIAFASFITGPLGILILLLAILALLFMILVLVQIIHTYILIVMAMSILLFFAPIMVPMVLFNTTKSFFMAWFKELVSFVIYPFVLFTYVAMFFTTYDHIMYGDLDKYPETFARDGSINTDKDPDDDDRYLCDYEAPVCIFNVMAHYLKEEPVKLMEVNMMFITGFDTDDEVFILQKNLLIALFKMIIMGYLFYHFYAVLIALTSELTGNVRSQIGGYGIKSVAKGSALAGSGIDLAKTYGKKLFDAGMNQISGGTYGTAKKAASVARGGV